MSLPRFLSIFILSIFILGGCNSDKSQNELAQKIDRYLQKLELAGFNGSVLVANRDGIILSKGYGYSDKEHATRNTPNTVFDIGSITKQFTASAILKLELDGKLSTAQKLSEFFKDVPIDKANISLHDLLRHQSGLVGSVGPDFEKMSEDEFLQKVFASPLRFEPGTQFAYSNVGYSLLGMIIEKVSKQSYEEFLYTNLWQPSGMVQTGYSRPQFDKDLIATGYTSDDSTWGKPVDKLWNGDAPYWNLKGNGGILSTTGDLYKWHEALRSDRILSKEAKQKLYSPEIRAYETRESYYAYGWDVSTTSRNTMRVWHNGTNHIFYADLMRFVDENVVLVMLSNKWDPVVEEINTQVSLMIFNPTYDPEIPAPNNESNRNFTEQIMKLVADSGLTEAKEAYQSKASGVQLLEPEMREGGFQYIDEGNAEIAIRIFEMNVFVFPKSAKALQGLGEGYLEARDSVSALQYFKKSQSLNPENIFVRNMVRQIEGKQ